MNYNPSPRAVFCEANDRVSSHHNLVESDQLRKSIDVALLEYQQRLSRLTVTDLGGAATCHLKMMGVQEFLELFYNLCETSQVTPRTDSTNLAGNVKALPQQKKN